jgi:hypothetical protein
MERCQHKQFGAPDECGRPAVCRWQRTKDSRDVPEPRCEIHNRPGFIVYWMRGEQA